MKLRLRDAAMLVAGMLVVIAMAVAGFASLST